MSTPTIEQVKALDGRLFATLTFGESKVLEFFVKQQAGVSINLLVGPDSNLDLSLITTAGSAESAAHMQELLRARIQVVVL